MKHMPLKGGWSKYRQEEGEKMDQIKQYLIKFTKIQKLFHETKTYHKKNIKYNIFSNRTYQQ